MADYRGLYITQLPRARDISSMLPLPPPPKLDASTAHQPYSTADQIHRLGEHHCQHQRQHMRMHQRQKAGSRGGRGGGRGLEGCQGCAPPRLAMMLEMDDSDASPDLGSSIGRP